MAYQEWSPDVIAPETQVPYVDLLVDLLHQPDRLEAARLIQRIAEGALAGGPSPRTITLLFNDLLRASCSTPWAEHADVRELWTAYTHLWYEIGKGEAPEKLIQALMSAVHLIFRIPSSEKGSERQSIIKRCVAYINANCCNNITLDDVAEEVHLSPTHVSRLLREELGLSFMRLLTESRVEKAKRLIVEEDAPLHWVAGQVGYKSATYFSRVFRKETGESPSEYRERVGRFLEGSGQQSISAASASSTH